MKLNTIYMLSMFILGISIMVTGTTPIYIGINVELGIFKYVIGLFFILLGIASFLDIKKNKVIPEYTKCPECEETYTYSELKDGKCPKCDIQTIDMDKYYK